MYVCGLSLDDKCELQFHNVRGTAESCSESESLEHRGTLRPLINTVWVETNAMDLLQINGELQGNLMESATCLDMIDI